jgi:hypothetical protein
MILSLALLICLADGPTVEPPPESFFALVNETHRAKARRFYTKSVDVHGMPVLASAAVADEALLRAHEIVEHLLAGRPDVFQAMVEQRMYLIIIGKDQVYTDMPEYSNQPDPAYVNERVRGTGGRPTSFGEENLLSLPLDRYDDESIAVHEFCHTIDGALRSVDASWPDRLRSVFRSVREKGLYANAYASSNPGEYWAEIAQSYFDCNRVNNWNHGPVGTREQLAAYDPEGYALARDAFRLTPETDWRYRFLQRLPNVIAPPARFGFDPWYTRFTFAREFPIVGRSASDDALLAANDTVRKLFAYRHDLLKSLIAEGVKLVVLGPGEAMSDLPEFHAEPAAFDPLLRVHDYEPRTKTLVVSESDVLADPAEPGRLPNPVIAMLARAVHEVAGKRPAVPETDASRRNLQQYELRVKRLDLQFDERLQELHKQALAAGKWRGAVAAQTPSTYWCTGVLAYFDAMGQDAAPAGAPQPIRRREDLAAYDPGLYDLVRETMAYEGHVDWRYTPGRH